MSRIRYLVAAAVLGSSLWAQSPQPANKASSDLVLEVAKRVDAIYPSKAAKGKIQGQVLVRVSITDSGEVERAEIVSGDPKLTAAALTAAKGWMFKTWWHKKYVPLSAWANITFDFQLPDERSKAPGIPTDELVATGRVLESGELPHPLQVSPGVTQGLLIHKVEPVYPPEARAARVQGAVVLRATISKEGKVEKLAALSGDSMLVAAAMNVVRQWRYRPYTLNGEPVEIDTEVVIHFTLSER